MVHIRFLLLLLLIGYLSTLAESRRTSSPGSIERFHHRRVARNCAAADAQAHKKHRVSSKKSKSKSKSKSKKSKSKSKTKSKSLSKTKSSTAKSTSTQKQTAAASTATATASMPSDNERVDWLDPTYFASVSSSFKDQHAAALQALTAQANGATKKGPWTVAKKDPSGVPNNDPREYVTFARYYWPTSKVPSGNSYKAPSYCSNPKSASNQVLVWKNCPYENRDGDSVEDRDIFGDASKFSQMSFATFSNAALYLFTSDVKYAQSLRTQLYTWFLDSKTGIRPDIKYGQIIRGPALKNSDNDWTKGTFRGVVDWRRMVKISNAVTILRASKSKTSSIWTQSDDDTMTKWATQYYKWLSTDPISLRAKDNKNNIASFWYAQVAAVQILMKDQDGARTTLKSYFNGPFKQLISSNGNQPAEAKRSLAVHYTAFGAEAMIANARIAGYLGLDMWNTKTDEGATINDAVKYSLSMQGDASSDELKELAPHVATALAVYGDFSDNRYANFLANDKATSDPNKQASWRLYNVKGALAVNKSSNK